jgi:hypothetical protein
MDNNRFYIYCHRKKTDGKCFYIGKGTENRYKSKRGRNQHWKNIVNKHGFEAEILINNISEEKAFELESYFCNQIGYENLCNIRIENGDGGHSHSEETKNKMRKPKTENHKLNMRVSKGPQSKETIEKRRNSLKGKSKPKGMMSSIHKNNKKTVNQYDLDNNFIFKWKGIIDASLHLGINKRSISNCCLGINKSAGNFIWRFENI